MKRFICFILGLIFMLVSMSGCQKEKSIDSGHNIETPYRAFDTETLFEDLASAYYANAKDIQVEVEEYLLYHDVGTAKKPFLFPVMHSDQYQFYRFESNSDVNTYCYVHVDAPPINSEGRENFEIYILYAKDVPFSQISSDERFTMLSSNTARFNETNWWFFESVGGMYLSVMFPDSIPIESPDEVWDYISFEQYVVDAEGVHKLPEIIDGDDYR